MFFGGRDLGLLKEKERARLISYIPQEQSLNLNYSVLDYVLMGRAAFIPRFSVPSKNDLESAEEALRYVGLKDFLDRNFSELSSGERRLVAIARTLAQSAEILLLDEPTTFLDPKHEVEIMDLCRKLAAEKAKTIIMTLHNLEMALKYSDVMVFMKEGRIVASGPPDEILSRELLEMVYDMPMTIIPYGGQKLVLR